MSNVEKLSITLSKDMVEAIRDAVDSGDYATTSEVIRDALRGWRYRRITVDPSDSDTIRRLVEEGIASGPSVDADIVFDRLERKYAALAASGARRGGHVKRAKLSPSAEADLEEIVNYIGSSEGFANPTLARTMLSEIRLKCRTLARNPKAYQLKPEFGPDVRRAMCRRYLILFRELEGEIRIERILHGARDVASIMSDVRPSRAR